MKNHRTTRLLIATVLIVEYIFGVATIYAEGLLPSLSETVGIAMPSLGEALQRYPDSETENEDGSVMELYTNISETDFNTFSVYLEQQGAELADYHVEGSVLTAEIRAKDASFNLHYDSKSVEAKVTYPSGTFDEWMKNAKMHFEAGQKLMEEGKTDEAMMEFLAISQYSEYAPAAALLQNDDNLAAAAEIAAARKAKYARYRRPGYTVAFGHYEQDNNSANGPERIQWIVLDCDEKEHKVLLLSRYGLDAIPYNTEMVDMTWEKCTLRSWLNGEFLQSAFSSEEQDAILTTMVDNSASQGYSKRDTDGGNNTQDMIFLLSCAEANRYLNVTYDANNNASVRVAPTAYAIANGAWTSNDYLTADGEAAGWWWLRSPGTYRSGAARVGGGGALANSGVNGAEGVVRPALWINLDADIF